jgi:hypothetical protein
MPCFIHSVHLNSIFIPNIFFVHDNRVMLYWKSKAIKLFIVSLECSAKNLSNYKALWCGTVLHTSLSPQLLDIFLVLQHLATIFIIKVVLPDLIIFSNFLWKIIALYFYI